MDIKGSPRLYGKTAVPLAKIIEHVYIPIDEHAFYFQFLFASWIRNPASTKDLKVEILNPSNADLDEWQNAPIPFETLTTPAAFGFVDFSKPLDIYYENLTNIHLIITGQDANDPPVINLTCYGIQPFTQKEVTYGL